MVKNNEKLKIFFPFFYLVLVKFLSLVRCLLALSPSTPCSHLFTFLCHSSVPFQFSHNTHYITPITRHCHANNLPSTEHVTETQPKQDKILVAVVFVSYFSSFSTIYLLFCCWSFFLSCFSSFLTIYLLFKCHFVAWQKGFPWKCACQNKWAFFLFFTFLCLDHVLESKHFFIFFIFLLWGWVEA